MQIFYICVIFHILTSTWRYRWRRLPLYGIESIFKSIVFATYAYVQSAQNVNVIIYRVHACAQFKAVIHFFVQFMSNCQFIQCIKPAELQSIKPEARVWVHASMQGNFLKSILLKRLKMSLNFVNHSEIK